MSADKACDENKVHAQQLLRKPKHGFKQNCAQKRLISATFINKNPKQKIWK